MVGSPPRIGAAKAYVATKLLTTTAGHLTTLTYTACANTPIDNLLNEVNQPLDTTAQYYFILTPLGGDSVNGGLTIAGGSPISGPVTVNSSQNILINIAASNYTSNLNQAYAMGIWMAKNTGLYQLQNYAYIDPNGNDFNFEVNCEPLPTAIGYPASALQATTQSSTYPEFGNRLPFCCSFSQVKTTGGVSVARNVGQVTVPPDDSSDYILATFRGTTITFNSLPNDMKDLVKSAAGKYAKYTVNGGHTVETSNMSLQTAVALTTGNIPFKLVLPPDQNRVVQVVLFLASISTNQSPSNENWTKTAITPLTYTVQTINADSLLNDCAVEISYKFKV